MCIYRDCLPLYCVGIALLINSCADRNDGRWEELKALPYIEVCGEEVHTDKNFDGRDFYAVDSGRVLMSSFIIQILLYMWVKYGMIACSLRKDFFTRGEGRMKFCGLISVIIRLQRSI